MAQLVDFTTLPEKNKDWHLYFVRELLEHVATEAPSERKYTKWVRERKVFDRKFLAFAERLVGLAHTPGQAPALSEVGRDLWDGLQKAKKKLADDAEKARKPVQLDLPPNGPIPPPGRRAAPQPARAKDPEPDPDEDTAFGDGDKAAPVASAADPFLRELLDRFLELHGYLAKFVLGEIGDGYLAVSELYRRIGTSAYVGRRPPMPPFEAWIRWCEWLGGIEKIGFRHRATETGRDLGKYYKSLPDAELLAPSPEDELAVEIPVAVPVPAAVSGPALVPNAPSNRRTLDVRDDESDEGDGDARDGDGDASPALASEEGLDLPPEPRPPEPTAPFWAVRPHDDAAVARGPLPEPVLPAPPPPLSPAAVSPAAVSPAAVSPAPVSPVAVTPTPVVSLAATTAAPPEAPVFVAPQQALPREDALRARAPAPDSADRGRESASSAWARPAIPYSGESGDPGSRPRLAAAAGHVLAWWHAAGRPGERVRASEAGLDLTVYRGPGRGVVLFKLLTLGALLEAGGERGRGLTLCRELESRRALEALFVEDLPLERALEPAGLLDPARALGSGGEKLVHALRFRAALKRDGVLARIDAAASGRELARILRREVTGDSLGSGVVFAVREMARAGHWRHAGVDGLGCVPWRDVREAAARLGLLESSRAAGLEDLLAASEALSRFFRESEEGETPLVAYAVSTGWTPRPEGDLA